MSNRHNIHCKYVQIDKRKSENNLFMFGCLGYTMYITTFIFTLEGLSNKTISLTISQR